MEEFFIAALKAVGLSNPLGVISIVCLVGAFWIIRRLLTTIEVQGKAIGANTVVLAEIKTLLNVMVTGGVK